MRILALDSSGLVASVAVLENGMLLAEYTVNYKKTHSETLLPMIDEVMRMLETDVAEIDAIAIAKGPGSFTGLRIGAATAKGLGLALKKPLVPVPTVDALACNLMGLTNDVIVPMMDARRQQVYTGIYRFENGSLKILHEQWPAAVEELTEILNAMQEPVTVLGDGVPVYRSLLEKQLRVPFTEAPAHQNRQRAASVAMLGMQYLKDGNTVSAEDFVPEYLRLSQAERERLEKEKQNTEI